MMIVRLRRGIVGETRRVCHLVPATSPGVPAELSALCGEVIQSGQADLLPGLRGMPCDRCLAQSARALRLERAS
ncbi:hypothetical protein [Amycolatopsis sp. YIM 10]|uniref:hypothetical protein n=1 Tax=Amycolatopsis sp. YIM 10 TaxID=2653857 RepID=UPI0012A9E9C3|nr:hypothetical protein [Amycolatopsis sp. YIM 10]QFU89360.1 hypothetical protein YIM_20905 [Amycolatopsis sp. YIM 10]